MDLTFSLKKLTSLVIDKIVSIKREIIIGFFGLFL